MECRKGHAEMRRRNHIRFLQFISGVVMTMIILLFSLSIAYAEEESFIGEGSCEAFEPYITCTEYIQADGTIRVEGIRDPSVRSKSQRKYSEQNDTDTAAVMFISDDVTVEVSDRYYIGDRLYVYKPDGRKAREYQVRQECVIHLPEVPESYENSELAGWVSEWDDISQAYRIRPVYAEKTIIEQDMSQSDDMFLEMNGIHGKEQKDVCVLHWILFGIDFLLGVVFFSRLMASLTIKE